jgi:hypothetical protein
MDDDNRGDNAAGLSAIGVLAELLCLSPPGNHKLSKCLRSFKNDNL